MKAFLVGLFLLIGGIAFGQSPSLEYKLFPLDSLVQGTRDTARYELGGKYNRVYVTIFDSGSTYTDTLVCEVYSPGRATWIRVGGTALFANTTSAFFIPNANYYQVFRLLHDGANRVRFRYLSTGYVATVGRRTYLQVEGVRNY